MDCEIIRVQDAAFPTKVIPVVFSTDENYAPFVSACVESIRGNSSKEYLYEVYVFNVGLPERIIKTLEAATAENISVKCVDVSSNIESIADRLYSHSYFSREMYYRILIPEVLSQYDKVIYLDCDMIVLGDLSELYNMDIGDNCIAACRNLMHSKMRDYVENDLHLNSDRYINSGMLVINCKSFIEQNIRDLIFEEIKLHDVLRYPDQDLINLVCKDKIYYLPLKWNYLWHLERLNKSSNNELKLIEADLAEYKQTKSDICIMHYTGDKKPWFYNAIPGAEIFWKYAELCTLRNTIKQRFREHNKKLQKIKLVFMDIKGKNLTLTCSYNVLDYDNKDTYLYLINNNIYRPTISHKRQIETGNVLLTQRLFSVSIPLKNIMKSKQSICFVVNNKCVLFEYDKFFPLNGCSNSYIATDGVLVYREGNNLLLEKCTFRKRMKHERAYLKQLRKSDDPRKKKYFWVRILRFLTKRLVPKNIWLISDRPNVAGDNGEALFKYLNSTKKYKKVIKPYFVIDKSSPDYARLKKIGKVLALSSKKHKLYALHCAGKAVSQTDRELYEVIVRDYVKDFKYAEKRVFLQHGITKDDISKLYSRFSHGFDLFVTACYPEYDSIVKNANYGCGASITKLTGFPRHDALDNKTEKVVVISPTWRQNLAMDGENGIEEFKASEYFARWHGLLNNKELISAAKENDCKIWFVPHNKFEHYLDLFSDLDEQVSVLKGNKNFAEIFSKGALMISDYSSNSFEFAYLRKPIIYYQYDADVFFGEHTYNKGYFDYETDGFGDVIKDEAEVVEKIKYYMQNGFVAEDEYLDKITTFFKFSDKNNSERVVKAMMALH